MTKSLIFGVVVILGIIAIGHILMGKSNDNASEKEDIESNVNGRLNYKGNGKGYVPVATLKDRTLKRTANNLIPRDCQITYEVQQVGWKVDENTGEKRDLTKYECTVPASGGRKELVAVLGCTNFQVDANYIPHKMDCQLFQGWVPKPKMVSCGSAAVGTKCTVEAHGIAATNGQPISITWKAHFTDGRTWDI